MAESLSCGKANTIQLMVGLTRSILPFNAIDPQDRWARPETLTTMEYREALDRGTGSAISAVQKRANNELGCRDRGRSRDRTIVPPLQSREVSFVPAVPFCARKASR